MDLTRLAEEFDRKVVSWRAQSLTKNKDKAQALAYIDARDVMDKLDAVCGPDRWQSEFTETPKGRVLCRIGIRMDDGEWVWKSDGAGNTDVEGEKGAISDALKRAAVHWGVARYLYALPTPWVPCEVNDQGKWRKWTADPWDFVRTPPKPAASPAPAPKQQAQPTPPPFNPQATRNALIHAIEAASSADVLDRIKADPAFKADYDRLAAADKKLAAEVVKAGGVKRLEFGGVKVPMPPGMEDAVTDVPGAFQ